MGTKSKPIMTKLEQHDVDGVRVLRLSGDLTGEGVADVGEAFAEAVRGQAPVVVDLGGIRLITTPGISMLLAADREFKASGRVLVLTEAQPFVRNLLHLCRLDTVLTVVAGANQAIKHARTGG